MICYGGADGNVVGGELLSSGRQRLSTPAQMEGKGQVGSAISGEDQCMRHGLWQARAPVLSAPASRNHYVSCLKHREFGIKISQQYECPPLSSKGHHFRSKLGAVPFALASAATPWTRASVSPSILIISPTLTVFTKALMILCRAFESPSISRCLITSPNLVTAAGVILAGPRSSCWRRDATLAFSASISVLRILRRPRTSAFRADIVPTSIAS